MLKSSNLTSQLIPTIITHRGVLAMLVASQILASILALAPFSYDDFWVRLGIFSLFIHCVSVLGFSILYALRHLVSRCSLFFQVFIIIAIFQCMTAGLSALIQYLPSPQASIFEWSFVLKNMAICFLMSLLFIHSMSIFLDKLQTTKTLSRIELEALSARIRPHFLYNSLNTIAELTQGDKNDAEQAVLSLAQLCKAAMRTSELTTLRAELDLARQYIDLERWRYVQRLDVRWYLPKHIPEVTLPVLSVQPLLENAIVYGVESHSNVTRIDIDLLETKTQVVLRISNQYSQEKVNQYSGEGIAQDNIKARLALHFGSRARFDTEQTCETYTAILTFLKEST